MALDWSYGTQIQSHARHPLPPPGQNDVSLCRYDLVSVIVHHGHSVSSGHYVAYVKSASGVWHLADDARVGSVRPQHVLRQQAYILLYTRRSPRLWLYTDRRPAATAAAATAEPAARQTISKPVAEAVASSAAAQDPAPQTQPLEVVATGTTAAVPPVTPEPSPEQAVAEGSSTAAPRPPHNAVVSRSIAPFLSVFGRSAKTLQVMRSIRKQKGTVMRASRTRHAGFVAAVERSLRRVRRTGARTAASGADTLQAVVALMASPFRKMATPHAVQAVLRHGVMRTPPQSKPKPLVQSQVGASTPAPNTADAGQRRMHSTPEQGLFGEDSDREPGRQTPAVKGVSESESKAPRGGESTSLDCAGVAGPLQQDVRSSLGDGAEVKDRKPAVMKQSVCAAEPKRSKQKMGSLVAVMRGPSDDVAAALGLGSAGMGVWHGMEETAGEQAAARAAEEGRRKRVLDEYDEEYDRGKVKKVRRKGEGVVGPGAKKFQELLEGGSGGEGRDRGSRRGGGHGGGHGAGRRGGHGGGSGRGSGRGRGPNRGRGRGGQRGGRGRGRGFR